MKPRIGIIHYSYPPIIGGVETIVRQQAHKFSDSGYHVTLMMGEGFTSRKDIEFVEIPEFKSLRNINPELYQKILDEKEFPPDFFELSNRIYSELERLLPGIDIVIVHNMLTFKFNLAFNFAFRKYIQANPNKKIIAWTHDVSLDPERKRAVFINSEIEELIYKPIPNVVYVGISNFLKKTLVDLIGFPNDVIQVIPNAIPIQEFLDLNPTTKKIIDKYDLLSVDPLIFMPGKMMVHKNVDLAVKIVSELKKMYPEVKLALSARTFHHNKNNEYVKKIYDMIHGLGLDENVLIIQDELGDTEASDFDVIKDLYKISDIVFFFSSYENFGLPILEAGITKNLIICSDLEVFHEISSENIHHIDITNSSVDIAKSINYALNEHKTERLFREIKRKYSLDVIFDNQILPLIHKISNQK